MENQQSQAFIYLEKYLSHYNTATAHLQPVDYYAIMIRIISIS